MKSESWGEKEAKLQWPSKRKLKQLKLSCACTKKKPTFWKSRVSAKAKAKLLLGLMMMVVVCSCYIWLDERVCIFHIVRCCCVCLCVCFSPLNFVCLFECVSLCVCEVWGFVFSFYPFKKNYTVVYVWVLVNCSHFSCNRFNWYSSGRKSTIHRIHIHIHI